MNEKKTSNYYICLLYCLLILLFNVWLQNHQGVFLLGAIDVIGVLLALSVSTSHDRTRLLVSVLALLAISVIYYSIGVIQVSIVLCILLALGVGFIFRYLLSVDEDGTSIAFISVGVLHSCVSLVETVLHKNPWADFFAGDGGYTYTGNGLLYRAEGITTHPIIAGVFSITCCFLCIALFVKQRKKRYVFIGILLFFSAILTGSRNVYLCLAVTILCSLILCLLYYTQRKIQTPKIRTLLIAIILATLLIWQLEDSTSWMKQKIIGRFSGVEQTGSYLQRVGSLRFLQNLLSNLMNVYVWVGHGVGSLQLYLQSHNIYFVTEGFYIVDNQYVTAIYEIGLIGVMACAIALLTLVKHCFQYASASSPEFNQVQARMMPILSLVYFLASIFFFEFYGNILCQMLFAFIIAQLAIVGGAHR